MGTAGRGIRPSGTGMSYRQGRETYRLLAGIRRDIGPEDGSVGGGSAGCGAGDGAVGGDGGAADAEADE